MAFELKGFDKLTASNLSFAPIAYVYGTLTDSLATVQGSGYFNSVGSRLKPGYFIFTGSVTTPGDDFDQTSILKVTAVSPDVLTAELDDAGGNDVISVNGKDGVVVLTPADLQVIETTAATTFTLADDTTYLGVTAIAGGPATMTLPSAPALIDGFQVLIKDESGDAGADNITINTAGSETIDGATSLDIIAAFGVARLYVRAGNWHTF